MEALYIFVFNFKFNFKFNFNSLLRASANDRADFYNKGIQVLGVEPTSNTAAVAISKGIDTVVDFFGKKLAQTLVDKNINQKDALKRPCKKA